MIPEAQAKKSSGDRDKNKIYKAREMHNSTEQHIAGSSWAPILKIWSYKHTPTSPRNTTKSFRIETSRMIWYHIHKRKFVVYTNSYLRNICEPTRWTKVRYTASKHLLESVLTSLHHQLKKNQNGRNGSWERAESYVSSRRRSSSSGMLILIPLFIPLTL